MLILVLNVGSSSVKYQVVDTDTGEALVKGLAENIGEGGVSYEDAIAHALGSLPKSLELSGVGHRVVHGGTMTAPTLITDEVEGHIESLSGLAPLHNPANLAGIHAARKALPALWHVAVFDTAFHQSMPAAASTVAIPEELVVSAGIRKYGFHGTSHQYVSRFASTLLGGESDTHKIISLHLGNGSSAAAIAGGRCMDTSMGLTPIPGLVMGTRPGDLDPGIVLHLLHTVGLSATECDELLTQHSGLLALAGTSDFREITQAALSGETRALAALEVWGWRIRHYIGAYAAVLGGVDAVIFTGGIGENSGHGRLLATKGLEFLGITIDPYLNSREARGARTISPAGAAVTVMVIPTNEEREIATQSADLISTAR